MPDRALVERAQHGDRDAYERIALEAGDRLIAIAQRIVRDIDRAEDAVQQTLVAMWMELPRLRDPDRFDVWTYRLVVRFSLAEARRHRRIGVSVEPLSAELLEPRNELDGVGARDELERAFRSISPEHRAVLVLFHYLGLSQAEIATALRVPIGTVGSRLHRATERMRAALDADSRVTGPEGAIA